MLQLTFHPGQAPEVREDEQAERWRSRLTGAITLALDAKIRLRDHMGRQLFNGLLGVIRFIIYSPGSAPPNPPSMVLVEFPGLAAHVLNEDDERFLRMLDQNEPFLQSPNLAERLSDLFPIWPTSSGGQSTRSAHKRAQTKRQGKQLPIEIANAVTPHAVQGGTYRGVQAALGTEERDAGSALVMLSRCTDVRRLLLWNFSPLRLAQQGMMKLPSVR